MKNRGRLLKNIQNIPKGDNPQYHYSICVQWLPNVSKLIKSLASPITTLEFPPFTLPVRGHQPLPSSTQQQPQTSLPNLKSLHQSPFPATEALSTLNLKPPPSIGTISASYLLISAYLVSLPHPPVTGTFTKIPMTLLPNAAAPSSYHETPKYTCPSINSKLPQQTSPPHYPPSLSNAFTTIN